VNAVAPGSDAAPAGAIGRYEVLARLATGGMAEILLGRVLGPSGFERAVVIKRILAQYAELPTFVSMFLDEARIAARIHHPNVVQVHELGQEGGELYLVMEYLQGESAASVMRRASALGRPIELALCAHIVAEACAGLHAAHELKDADGESMSLVHRDVSPQNLFITYDGSVKVLDFGIAKAKDRISQTEAGTLKGKFEYMSPEQAEGLPIDRRSDVFALGVVLYELSTGRRLFKRGSAVESLRAVREGLVTPPTRLIEGYPKRLEEICLRALAADPQDRYATAADLRRDLALLTRELSGDSLPGENLAALMRLLFATRVEEKRRLLESVQRGTAIERVPSAEVDVAVELPTVGPAKATRPLPPPHRRRGWLAFGVAVFALAFAGTLGFLALQGAEDDVRAAAPPAPAPEPEPAPVEAPPPEPPVAPPEEVVLRVETTPAGATVSLDGEVLGETPTELTVPRSEQPRTLRLERDGYRPLEREVRPEMSQLLQIGLQRLPRRGRSRPTPSEPEAEPMFRRFD